MKKIEYLSQHRLACVLNNTKWQRLFDELIKIQSVVTFKRKDVNDVKPFTTDWEKDLYYIFSGCESIEWLDIRAVVTTPRGHILAPTVEDHTPALFAALKQACIPFSRTLEGIRVWGYLRAGVHVEWVE